jgi:hypothetical protein
MAAMLILAIKDAGIGARTIDGVGRKLSTAPASKPAKVVVATLKAIDKRKVEIVVNPGPVRFIKSPLDYFPGLGRALKGRAEPPRS